MGATHIAYSPEILLQIRIDLLCELLEEFPDQLDLDIKDLAILVIRSREELKVSLHTLSCDSVRLTHHLGGSYACPFSWFEGDKPSCFLHLFSLDFDEVG